MAFSATRFSAIVFGRTLLGRFSRLSATIVAGALLVLSVSAYYAIRVSLERQLDDELVEVASRVTAPIVDDIVGMGGLNNTALSAANVLLVLVRADGRMERVQDDRIDLHPGNPELMIARTQLGYSTRSVNETDGLPYRMVAVPLQIAGERYALVLARSLLPTSTTLETLRVLFWWLSVAFVAVAVVAGLNSGRKVVEPLNDLADAVAHVTDTDELTPIGNDDDTEVGELSRSFDAMMLSLSVSRERQRRLIADAGHELRTPLTSMRTNIELLVADETSAMLPGTARTEILGDVAEQLGEFTALVSDLVQLAREDKVPSSSEPFDLADVVSAAIERVRRRGHGLTFDVSLEPYYVIGETSILERAVINLLDNAVKWSPAGGTVHVLIKDGVLTVTDEGSGIAKNDLPHVFERFYRSDKARSTPGTGLGLSIVDQAVTAHGGVVRAANTTSGGAVFTVELPPAENQA
ncbi:MAG: HAMP domain-containing histidine kinase [Propionibacteriaceae bacterium]|jgi:two-component system sensor histidine kinase MprB|nr:HAMP domain-containing histidine kinase [Propionibacteriaceae bacterium]